MENFEFITKIGSGSYGNVYKALDHSKNTYKAVKKFKRTYASIAEGKEEIEVQILPLLKHSNIVGLNKIIYENENLYLIMDLAKMDLGRYFQNVSKDGGKLIEGQIKKFMKQIVSAVQFMHKQGYMHRDLKPENILIADDNTLKLADLGTSK